MSRAEEVLRKLAVDIGERPTGTEANEAANSYLESVARELGYEVTEIGFECRRWELGPSEVSTGTVRLPVHPGPFSGPLRGDYPVVVARTLEELRTQDAADSLLVIRGPLAQEPLMPRDFPFYYPEEHKAIIDLLLEKRPAAVLALTGTHPLCGLSPFPLFEDGNLGIPNAYADDFAGVLTGAGRVRINLDSASRAATGRQLVFSRPGPSERRVVVAAHVDTKYETPGALDNAAGVATAVSVMDRLRDATLPFAVDIVPFNGEEYFGVSGQLAYLEHRAASPESIRLMINLDGLGHRDSASAFSVYNLDDASLAPTLRKHSRMVPGEEWIAGDHAIFAFRGVPSLAVTSSNLMEKVVTITHTPDDTVEHVDVALLEETAAAIADIVGEAGG